MPKLLTKCEIEEMIDKGQTRRLYINPIVGVLVVLAVVGFAAYTFFAGQAPKIQSYAGEDVIPFEIVK